MIVYKKRASNTGLEINSNALTNGYSSFQRLVTKIEPS